MPDDNAFETLRRQRTQFGEIRHQASMLTGLRAVLRTFDGARFIEPLTQWEFGISEYHALTTEILPHGLETKILLTMTTCGICRYLCMQVRDVVSINRRARSW